MENKLKYFDALFTSGPLPKGVAVKYARRNGIQVEDVNDYFNLLLDMFGITPADINMTDFKREIWDLVRFNKKVLRVGQIVRLVNKRFTGNRYRILALYDRGFDVENTRLPKYKFYDLDYNSIEKILNFQL